MKTMGIWWLIAGSCCLLIGMHGLAALLFPLVLMLFALGIEKLEERAMRGSGAVAPEQVDTLLIGKAPAKSEPAEVADVAVLPATGHSTMNGARRAS
ncbi:hypothetical protein [Gordonia araii]